MFNVLGGHCNVILGLRSQLRLSKCTRKSYEQRLKVTEDYFSTGEMDGKYARITVSSDGTHRLWCETASQLELQTQIIWVQRFIWWISKRILFFLWETLPCFDK